MPGHERQFLLHHCLINSAFRSGGTVAVVEEQRSTTFEQLLESATRLAATLSQHGLDKGDRVALVMPKSTDAIIALFAVLMCGGLYVPLDPRWPPQRIEGTLSNCAPRFAVVGAAQDLVRRIPALAAAAGEPEVSPLIVDLTAARCLRWEDALSGSAGSIPAIVLEPDDPALILFTSGSTGKPKGVTLSHRAVAAFVAWSAQEFNLAEGERLACPSPLGFDLSTFDIFNMALCGATCLIVPEPVVWVPRFLAQFLSDLRITCWYSVPSVLSSLLHQGGLSQRRYPDLRTVIFAGEVLPSRNLASLRAAVPGAVFYNLYGPTETNVVTWYRVPSGFDPSLPVPIGTACPYAELMFDPEDAEEHGGIVTGHLLVAGDSLMSGYWNQPEETENALVQLCGSQGISKRFYRTGDRVSFDSTNGNYLFVGRKDRQVKRRGYRIELGEVEAALCRHPDVLEAGVVSSQDQQAQTTIVAFVSVAPHASVSLVDLRTHCAHSLPAYMIPDHVEFLRVLPKGSRGKTDYQALAAMMPRS